MTNEMKMFIDNTIDYMNYCRRMANEMKFKYFSVHDHDLCIERCITLYATINELLKMFGMKVIKDEDGFYSVM